MLAFFALTFLVTWTFFIAAAALSGRLPFGASPGPGLRALVLLGTFGPSVVALGLTARAEGRAGVRALLSRLFEWRVKAQWYVFAAGYMVAIKLTVALVHRLVTGAWPRFGSEAWYIIVAALVISTSTQAGEEIGWRGYALPRLAARIGLGGASLVLGVIWATWHLPLFFFHGAEAYRQSFLIYLLSVTAVSVAIAWLYWHTHGSLLLVMLMHAAINNTKDIVPSIAGPGPGLFALSASPVGWLTLALMWIAAAYFLVRMRKSALRVRTASAPPPPTASPLSG